VPDNRASLIAWSAGVSAVAAAFAGTLASRATTPLSHNRWFIACVVVACAALAILLLMGPALLVSWWRVRQTQARRRGNVLPRVSEVEDRALLGIHSAIPLMGEEPTLSQEFPLYVSRDVDHNLEEWIANHRVSGGLLLLVGPAAAGKTRTAYELVQRTLGDWRLFMPANAAQITEFIMSTDDNDDVVVWLNDIQNFFGPDGLTSAIVRRMLADTRSVILIGTIWPDRYEALTELSSGSEPADPNRDAREILGMLADRRDLPSEFTAAEFQRARALAHQDPRLAEALRNTGRGKLAAMLAAAPELVRRWVTGTNQQGAAIISAAVFARLCGHPELLPATVLESLADCFLTSERRAQLTSGSWLPDAIEWVQRPVRGNVAPLIPQSEAIGRIDGYLVSDVLVQHGIGDPRITGQLDSETTWLRLIDAASPSACAYVAAAALVRPGPQGAFEEATRKSAIAGNIQSMVNMGILLYESGDTAEAHEWFAKATATNHPVSLTSVGRILTQGGEQAEAEAMLRKAADMGFAPAMDALSDLLQERGDAIEAESWLRRAAATGYPPAVNSLGMLLHFRGEKLEAEDLVRKAAEAGYLQAVAFLGVLLSERGDTPEAEVWLRLAARFGHPIAMTELGSLLLRRGETAEAEEWWRRSAAVEEPRAMTYLGTLLKEHGQVAEAETLWRTAADAGSQMSTHNMGMLSYERGNIAEAEGWLRKAAEAGQVESMGLLAVVLNDRGENREAEEWLRKSAEAGSVGAMLILASQLTERGETAEAERWWREAADLGNTDAMRMMGSLLYERGEMEEAEYMWRRATEAGSIDASVNLGILYQNRGEASEAETLFRTAADAGNTYAMTNLALVLMEQGKLDEAISLLRNAAGMDSPEAMSNLAVALERRGEEAEAELWMRKAVDTGHSGAMANLGNQLLERGEMAEAEQLLRKSADMSHPRGMYNFGRLLHNRGENAAAEQWRQKAAVQAPENEWPSYTD
jgi:TPR repeat protein